MAQAVSIAYLKYILPLVPTLATVKGLPSFVLGFFSVSFSFRLFFIERCRMTSLEFFTCRNELARFRFGSRSGVLFFSGSRPSSRLCRAVPAFSWPEPIKIEGISVRSSFHALFTGVVGLRLAVEGLEVVATGAMTEASLPPSQQMAKW